MRVNNFVIIIFFLIMGCESIKLPQKSETPLFKLGDSSYDIDEFVYVYSKNNLKKDSAFNRQDVEDYFKLYVNFKLKVKEAKSQGFDTTAAFRNEFIGYQKQLAKPYLTESKVSDQLVNEAYERLKSEISAAHILFRLDPNAIPEDTAGVYEQAMKIKAQIESGADFSEMAEQFSADPSAKRNGGNLGYFSALQMVYPFESACYETPIGQISQPVRTRFGYHLIKVLDKRPSQGKVKVSHIMIRSNTGMPPDQQKQHEEKIREIYKKLQEGENWNLLCSQFSEDYGSNKKGGQLPWIGTGNVDPTFEATAFALQKPGDISEPFLSPYGWHIIKLNEKQGIQPLEEMREELNQRISKDSRSALGDELLVKRLKEENQFVANIEIKTRALSIADSSLIKASWMYSDTLDYLQETLFSIQELPVSVDSFYHYIVLNQRRIAGTPEQGMQGYYDQFEKQVLKDYEEAQLSVKYPDYKMISNEYYEGILLFEIMDQNVWSKAMEDTTGLRDYYNTHIDRYQYGERMQGMVIDAANTGIIDSINARYRDGYYVLESIIGKGENIISEFTKLGTGKDGKKSAKPQKIATWINAIRSNKASGIIITCNQSNDAFVNGIKQYVGDNINPEDFLVFKSATSDQCMAELVSENVEDLSAYLNRENPLAVQFHIGDFEKSDLEILNEIEWEVGEEINQELDGRHYFIRVEEILPPSPKEFNDIKGIVISDYQNYLDENWIRELKEKYPLKVYDDAFEKSVEKIRNK